MTTVASVRDQVNTHHRRQSRVPGQVAVLTHDGLELLVVEDEVIEARERYRF
jgi:hypothetical protein